MMNEKQRVTTTQRESITYLVEGQKVFGMLHRPARALDQPRPAILILHGLVGSKDQPHQIFVKLAEALATAGLIALRIDLRGRGDSEGDMASEVTPSGDLADARAALDWLTQQSDVAANQLGILGLSWGGALAAVLAGQDARLRYAMLWNIGSDIHYWQPKDYQEIAGQLVIEIWGNLIGKQFFAGISEANVPSWLPHTHAKVLIVQSTADEVIHDPINTARKLADMLSVAGVEHQLLLIDGADHGFMSYLNEAEVIGKTVAWLKAQLSARPPLQSSG